MNHGREFQKFWAQLTNEVKALRQKGYFGDGEVIQCLCHHGFQTIAGYWSGGTRLSDSSRVGGDGVGDYDLPEYVVRHCYSHQP